MYRVLQWVLLLNKSADVLVLQLRHWGPDKRTTAGGNRSTSNGRETIRYIVYEAQCWLLLLGTGNGPTDDVQLHLELVRHRRKAGATDSWMYREIQSAETLCRSGNLSHAQYS